MAFSPELGIGWPAWTVGRAKANGLKKNPAGTSRIAAAQLELVEKLGRVSGVGPSSP
jgi:hypothetical protein